MTLPPLRSTLLLLVLLPLWKPDVLAQEDPAKRWNKVERLAQRNKPGAAFEEARAIYEEAHAGGDDLQAVRALLYMSGLYSDNAVQNRLFSIRQLEKELVRSRGLTKPVLQSMLAETYWQYWKQLRYRYYNRPDTVAYREYDPDTWNASDYHRKITSLFLESVSDEKLLQQTGSEAILPLLAPGNTRMLRPTLFDLLAFRAFSYFEDDERDILKPAYALDLDLAAAFAPAREFTERLEKEQDTSRTQHPALRLLRKLIRFHLSDNDPAALIDADIHRLSFVHRRSVHPGKKELYLEALNRIRREYGDHPAAAQASYLRAEIYSEQGNQWKPFGNDARRYDKVLAKKIADSILMQERMSEGKNNCANLLIQMQVPEINFETETVNIPGQPFRVRVRYQNTPVIHLRIVPFSNSFLSRDQPAALTRSVCSARPLREWQQTLPAAADMQPHRAEIKVDALAPGKYVLIIADQPDFANEKTTAVAQLFYVSSIGIIRQDNDFFLVDRTTGQPLQGASVQVWEKYNVSNTLIREKGFTYRSDSNGYFRVQFKSERAAKLYNIPLLLDVQYNGEQLFLDDNSLPSYSRRYGRLYMQQPVTDTSLFLFTDRSIYRPGQTVFFKGIALAKDSTGRNGSVVTRSVYTIRLVNTNWQTISTLELETNEFGAISGSFRLPVSGLTGGYQLQYHQWKEGAAFRVEEYKRPSFSAQLDPVTGKYLLNDSIRVTGSANAYAGNAIDGARVTYRVFRRARFLYDWYWNEKQLPYSREEEISSGETVTGDDGKFSFTFFAKPDTAIHPEAEPVFDYTIQADITDINGETRSAEHTMSVSYQPFIIKTDLPASVSTDKLNQVKMLTQNLGGEPVSVPLTIRFTRVQDEYRLIRQRYWDRSDQFTMTKTEYLRLFPNDEYDNESDPKNRPLGNTEAVIETKSDSTGNWASPGQLSRLHPGFYLVTISAPGTNGRTVQEKKYVELFATENSSANYPVYWRNSEGPAIETGGSAGITVQTAADNCYIIQQTSRGTGQMPPITTRYQFLRLNQEKKELTFTATPGDQGGYGLSWTFVKHNRIFTASTNIRVPWAGKELQLEYASFRDKTSPGSEENWKLIVRGNKNEKIAAEMLAGMYDASLDQLQDHNWQKPFLWPGYIHSRIWEAPGFSRTIADPINEPKQEYGRLLKVYDELLSGYVFTPGYFTRKRTEPLWWINPLDYLYSEGRNPRLMRLPKPVLPDSDGDGVTDQQDMEQTMAGCPVDSRGVSLDTDGDGIPDCKDRDDEEKEDAPVKVRTNFSETAFFFPHLQTDSTGAIAFSFTIPESLTRWKFQALTHTRDLLFGYSQRSVITRKSFMVQPNAPRFVREKDRIAFSAKLVNLTNGTLKGYAQLELLDEETNQLLDSAFRLQGSRQPVELAPGKSTAVLFWLEVPVQYSKPLTWRITAKATGTGGEKFSDGEQNRLPVLPGRLLVTESLPLFSRQTGTRRYQFSKLTESHKSTTLKHQALITEYTTNPAWYAIQSLPYLMEFPHECAEQTWNRYYANTLAAVLVQSVPAVNTVFARWAKEDSLVSGKNPELNPVMLEETPWLQDAAGQKRKLLHLFQKDQLEKEMEKAWSKLRQMQSKSGGFAWFRGGPDNIYITQYIAAGIGHLKKLVTAAAPGAWTEKLERKLDQVLKGCIQYIDQGLLEDVARLKKNQGEIRFRPSYTDIQRLYARSFFTGNKPAATVQKAIALYAEQATLNWTTYNEHLQGMIALVNYRFGEQETARQLLASLRQRARQEEETGMYWADSAMNARYYWYQAPIETQALLIEAFAEIDRDTASIDAMKTWLLRNKQTSHWPTTKATAEACYALLLQGTDWLSNEPVVEINLGTSAQIRSSDAGQETGTGYFKKTIEGTKVMPSMGNITVTVGGQTPPSGGRGATWGSVYWQYFEDLDKITPASSPLKLTKELFVERQSDKGPVLVPVSNGTKLKTGDKVRVRILLQTDRDMEFVHLKDMRASSLEPVNVLSRYQWQNGLGYYESTRDASTSFFFDLVRKGTHVFEYTLFATHAGVFSNGISTVQCMYAPEFSAHSEGVRIGIEQR